MGCVPSVTLASPALAERLDSRFWRALGWLLVLLVPFFGRMWLIGTYRPLFSWDAFTRLANSGTFTIRHWLPVPQLPIYVMAALGFEVPAIRLVYAAVASAAATGLGIFVSRLSTYASGIAAALLASTLTPYLTYSISPYQEGFTLLFLAIALIALHDLDACDGRRGSWLVPELVAAAALVCGVLCRFEMWGFWALLGVGFVVRRQWRRLRVLVPAALVMLVWVAGETHRPSPSPLTSEIAGYGPAGLVFRALQCSADSARQLARDVLWIGVPFAVVGAVVSFLRGGRAGRELFAFWAALMGLVVVRDVNAAGLTDRMTVLPSVFTITYASIGLHFLAQRVCKRSQAWLVLPAALVLAALFSHGTYLKVQLYSRVFAPEAQATGLLLELSRSKLFRDGIIVIPRFIPNQFGEKAVKAMFANSTQLDVNDERWLWNRDRIARFGHRARVIVGFDHLAGHYRVFPPQAPPAKDQGKGGTSTTGDP